MVERKTVHAILEQSCKWLIPKFLFIIVNFFIDMNETSQIRKPGFHRMPARRFPGYILQWAIFLFNVCVAKIAAVSEQFLPVAAPLPSPCWLLLTVTPLPFSPLYLFHFAFVC